jgi:antitoxin component of MazEF toxin-antitoxin module
MQQKTSLRNIGGSFYMLMPPALVEYLGLVVGEDTIVVEDKEKSKGRFAAIWKSK